MLLEAPIFPTLLRLSAPNVLNLAAIAGMITFDALFLGRLGADALAGVSLVFPFVMFAQHAAASGMGGAVSSAIARALGAGNRQRANDLAAHAFALAVGMAAVFSAVMLLLGPSIYQAMGGQGAVLQAALDYSTERVVIHAAAKPPRPIFREIAARLNRKILHLPLGTLSPATLRKIRVMHVLSGHAKRKVAKDYLW